MAEIELDAEIAASFEADGVPEEPLAEGIEATCRKALESLAKAAGG
jgi:hypothetical protein